MSKHYENDNLAEDISWDIPVEEINLKEENEFVDIRHAKLIKIQQKITKLKKESSNILKKAKECFLTYQDANQIAGELNGKFKIK